MIDDQMNVKILGWNLSKNLSLYQKAMFPKTSITSQYITKPWTIAS